MKTKIFEVVDIKNGKRHVRTFKRSGEKRPPKKGEYFLSGAIPQVYQAPNNLSYPYVIMVECKAVFVPAHYELIED